MDAATLAAYNLQPQMFADDWHAQPTPADLQAAVRKYFRPGLTADVGCGSGRDTAWLCENGYPAIGFDPSAGLIAEARRRYPTARFQQAELPTLAGAKDGGFANVLCETVIMHLAAETIPPAVRKLIALLEPEGTLYLTWRVTKNADRRDEHGRLYAAFDTPLVLAALADVKILLNEETTSASSGKIIHRIVARTRAS